MPRFPSDPQFVADVAQDIGDRLAILCRATWRVELMWDKQNSHVRVPEGQDAQTEKKTVHVSESAIRRLLVTRFYRKHTAVDPLLLSREGFIMDVVVKAIQYGFNTNISAQKTDITRATVICPECSSQCVLDEKKCILKQCDNCLMWFAKGAFRCKIVNTVS